MGRISAVEALRGLASVSVALFHFCNQLHSSGARVIAEYGWLGVDTCFVISGFVIPLSLYGRDYKLRDFPPFLVRRLIRLEPAYLVSIVVVLILWHLSSMAPGFAGGLPDYSMSQLASHFFYIIPLTSYSWINPVYWSLAYEFVFYITAGLTFGYLIKQNVAVTALLAASVFGVSLAIYGEMDVRILGFLVGALVMRLVIDDRTNFEIAAWLVASILLVFVIGGRRPGLSFR